jgi:hypothetical protein
MNLNLVKIFACLLTDGGISVKKGKPRVITFYNKSEKLREEFANAMKKVFNLKVHDDGFSCRVESIKVVKELLRYSPSFRKKKFKDGSFPPVTIPKEIMRGNKKVIQEFLRYAFSCDGSVHLSIRRSAKKNRWYFQKRIQLKCSHPSLLSQFHELLLKIGISARKEENQRRIIIDSKENILKFIKFVGFVEGVKVSGKGGSKWKGLEKNDILKVFLLLYEISDSLGAQRFKGGFWNRNFKDKDEIVAFLRKKAKKLLYPLPSLSGVASCEKPGLGACSRRPPDA